MKFHDELNPIIWDKDNDNQMRPEVLAKLKEIANAFIEYIEIPQDAVLDMVVTGSSASYNYNKFSDLDLHIVVDYDKIHEDCPLVEGYLGALKNTFNKEHDIFIKDVPVELYAEKKDQGTVHNGLYSVQNEEWIDRPQKIAPTDNDAAVEAKYQEIKDMVDKCDDNESATELLEKIYAMRKAGLAEAGEFCTENLAFKKLRNEGCMDKLREIKKKDIDKQLSLESYNESLEQDVKELTKTDDYYKVDGSRVSIKNGFGSQVELMDLQNLGKKLEKKGYKVYYSNYYIDAKKNKSIKEYKQLSLESYNETEKKNIILEAKYQKILLCTSDNDSYYKVFLCSGDNDFKIATQNLWSDNLRYLKPYSSPKEAIDALVKGIKRLDSSDKFKFQNNEFSQYLKTKITELQDIKKSEEQWELISIGSYSMGGEYWELDKTNKGFSVFRFVDGYKECYSRNQKSAEEALDKAVAKAGRQDGMYDSLSHIVENNDISEFYDNDYSKYFYTKAIELYNKMYPEHAVKNESIKDKQFSLESYNEEVSKKKVSLKRQREILEDLMTYIEQNCPKADCDLRKTIHQLRIMYYPLAFFCAVSNEGKIHIEPSLGSIQRKEDYGWDGKHFDIPLSEANDIICKVFLLAPSKRYYSEFEDILAPYCKIYKYKNESIKEGFNTLDLYIDGQYQDTFNNEGEINQFLDDNNIDPEYSKVEIKETPKAKPSEHRYKIGDELMVTNLITRDVDYKGPIKVKIITYYDSDEVYEVENDKGETGIIDTNDIISYVIPKNESLQENSNYAYESLERVLQEAEGIYKPGLILGAYKLEQQWLKGQELEDEQAPEIMLFIINDPEEGIEDTKLVKREDVYTYQPEENEFYLDMVRDSGDVLTDYNLEPAQKLVDRWNKSKKYFRKENNMKEEFDEAPLYYYCVEDIDQRGDRFDNAEEAYEQAKEDLAKLGYEVKELNDDAEFDVYSPSTGVVYPGVIYTASPEMDEDIATLEKKVDTATNDLQDIITSLENTINEALK